MRGGSPFSYAILRLVPRVERGEQLNVGVVVFSRPLKYLGARTELDARRVAALWPELDPETVRPYLAAIEHVASGDERGGPIAKLDPGERFYSLSSPSSTIIQPSEVHTGIAADPAAELEKLFRDLVSLPGTA